MNSQRPALTRVRAYALRLRADTASASEPNGKLLPCIHRHNVRELHLQVSLVGFFEVSICLSVLSCLHLL